MAPLAVTQPSITLVNCDPADMAAKAGLAIVPVDLLSSSSPPDHIVAIAVGVGVPGGLLLVTILVFIVVIYLNVRHRRSQEDCEIGTKKGRDSPDSGAPDRIRPFSHLASSLSWRISSPQPFASRPFTHTPNRSFSSQASSSVPPSYHSTEGNQDGLSQSTNVDSAVAEASEESAEDDPPPSRLISLSPTSINSKLSSPAPSATTFADSLSPSNL